MVLMLFFLLKDGYKMGSTFYKVLPFPDDMEKNIVSRLKEVIRVLLAGNLLIMILQGLMLGVGFFIGGIKMPLLWGSLGAILSLIPVVGTVLIWLPAGQAKCELFTLDLTVGWSIAKTAHAVRTVFKSKPIAAYTP